MRVISQNDSVDIAYDKATFYINETERKDYNIVAQLDNGREWIMATYSFEYLAKEAMTDLRNSQFMYKAYINAAGNSVETDMISALFYKFKTNNEYLEMIKKAINS